APERRLLRVDGERIAQIAFHPGGKALAIMTWRPDKKWPVSNALALWDIETGKKTALLRADGDRIAQIAFNPRGKALAITTWRPGKKWPAPNSLALWDIETGKKTALDVGMNSVAFSPDGTLVAAAMPVGVKLWDATTRKEKGFFPGAAERVAFSPDG